MPTRPITIDDLYTLTLVGDARISPDGRRVAYVVKRLDREKNDYVTNIFLWENGACRQFTNGGKDSAPRWSPDGTRLAFLAKRDDKPQIYVMPANGGEAWRLTDCSLGAGAPVWSPDGTSIAFAAATPFGWEPSEDDKDKPPRTHVIERGIFKADGQGLIDDRRTHIFVADVESKDVRQITEGDCNDDAPVWSPDGSQIAFVANRDAEWDMESTADVWIVPAAGGTPRKLTAERGNWWSPVFSPDGSEVAVVGYTQPEDGESTLYPQLWTVPRGGGPMRNLLDETDVAVGNSLIGDWSSAGPGNPIWGAGGIFFLVAQRGAVNIVRWQDGLHPVTEGSQDVMDFTVAGDGTIACTVSTLTQPSEVALVRNGQIERITSHNAEALAEMEVIEPERITFTGAEGVEVEGWLMKPAGFVEGQRYPLIVYIHGGPTGAYGESFFHEFQVLAGAGFGVFYCNPHGSTGHGQRFQVSIVGDWGNLDYADMMAGTDRVLEEPWVDPNRLGVAGGSYGGFLTNWIIGHTDRFAAACTQRSICNMVSQGGTSDWAAVRGERLGATPEGNPEKLWDMSPLKYASNVKTPTLILHSERDDRCPIEEGEQWFMALKRQGVPVRFVRFPEESHGLSRGGKPSRRAERLNHILDWFRTYL